MSSPNRPLLPLFRMRRAGVRDQRNLLPARAACSLPPSHFAKPRSRLLIAPIAIRWISAETASLMTDLPRSLPGGACVLENVLKRGALRRAGCAVRPLRAHALRHQDQPVEHRLRCARVSARASERGRRSRRGYSRRCRNGHIPHRVACLVQLQPLVLA